MLDRLLLCVEAAFHDYVVADHKTEDSLVFFRRTQQSRHMTCFGKPLRTMLLDRSTNGFPASRKATFPLKTNCDLVDLRQAWNDANIQRIIREINENHKKDHRTSF